MYQKTVAALSDRVAPYVPLSNDRRETLAQLTLGLLSARTTNLSVLAAERVASASTASTYRRYQRYFQFVELEEDWAAPVVAALAGLEGPRTLILDRTNWKVGRQEINLLMLAVKTRRGRLGLMWTVLDRPGNSGAKERIALIERYIARFGQESIGLLLGDREFIGTDWLNYLIGRDIPFVIRMREGQRAITAEGRSGSLGRLLLGPGGQRRAAVTLDAMAVKGVPGPAIAVRAVQPKGRKPVIVATNRPKLSALEAYRKRWAVESFFADAKTQLASTSRTPASPTPASSRCSPPSSPSPSPGRTPPQFASWDAAPRRERSTDTWPSPSSASASTSSDDSSGPPPWKHSTCGKTYPGP